MSQESTPLGMRVTSLTVKPGGSIDVIVTMPFAGHWFVSISRDGDWDIVNDLGEPPESATRSVIMATVSNYSIRRTFGGK